MGNSLTFGIVPRVSPTTSLLYRSLVRSGIALLPLVAKRRPKLKAGLAGRTGLLDRIARWAQEHREPSRPLLWLHAASAGEVRHAESVLRLLREAHPGWQIFLSYFSPSAAPFVPGLPVDFSDFLPWDRRRDVRTALRLLRPAALVFSKLDLWPELATQAAASGARVGLIGASVSDRSRRMRWPARLLGRAGYRAVAAAGAVSDLDAERLQRLGVARGRIEVSGDPRFDSVLARARAPSVDPARAAGAREATLVAGSTWPEDEELLLEAFTIVRRFTPEAKLVLVPHEPTVERLTAIERAIERRGLAATRWSAARGGESIVLVDRVGMLASLYPAARLAYVGGGLGRAGLHSVLEPAACGAAVLFGPEGRRHPDGARLLHLRAAVAVDPGFPDWLDLDSTASHATTPLAALWLALLRHPAHAREAGRRGKAYVEAGAGAAERNARLVERLMNQGSEVRGQGKVPLTAPG